jgi:hypothetical protein
LAQLGNFGTSKAWDQVVSSMIRPRMPHLQKSFDEAIDDWDFVPHCPGRLEFLSMIDSLNLLMT